MSSRLKETYLNEIVPAMEKKFGYTNTMQVPKLSKIVVNMGVGEAKDNAKLLESAMKDMEIITGQKPVMTTAKKSIANFKIREGMKIGCKVTLRGDRMYEFLDRLVNLALPRVRDAHEVVLTGLAHAHRVGTTEALPVHLEAASPARRGLVLCGRLEQKRRRILSVAKP